MTRWKTEEILDRKREVVAEKTADWDKGQLQEKLAEVLAAVEPIRYTLSSLVENPYCEGQVVSSGLFPEQFGEDRDLQEPWGAVHTDSGWEYRHFEWAEGLPEKMELQEARFDKDARLHPDTPILSVWQYHTACSIHGGTFDRSDVDALCAAATI